MPKNILIINSNSEKNNYLINLLETLGQTDCLFYLLSANSALLEYFRGKNWSAKKNYFGPVLSGKLNSLFFIFFLPFACLISFPNLLRYKFKKKIISIVCLNWNEKIIFTPIASLLKIKVIWIEHPDINCKKYSKPLLLLYKICSKKALIIVFTNTAKMQLQAAGISEKNIIIIPLGIKLDQLKFQDNIFNKLAKSEKINSKRKYFTVGTIADLNSQQRIKKLFAAVKICLTVIPDLQVIIIGDGEKRKDLIWLAKKLEIDNYVWFVGEQSHIKKWLDSFNLFIVSGETPNLADFENCLYAMAAGLPIISLNGFGFEDLIGSEKNQSGILIETDNSETFAEQIIKLYQNKCLLSELGKNAEEKAEKYFSIGKMAEEFEKIIR